MKTVDNLIKRILYVYYQKYRSLKLVPSKWLQVKVGIQ